MTPHPDAMAGADVAGQHPVDTVNDQLVGVQGGTVVVMFPKTAMTPTEAVRQAAWLAALAEAIDPDVDFAAVLAAVRSS